MPSTPLRIAAHVRHPLLPDLGGEHRAKPVPPKPDCLVANVDPALGQEILRGVASIVSDRAYYRQSRRMPFDRRTARATFLQAQARLHFASGAPKRRVLSGYLFWLRIELSEPFDVIRCAKRMRW